MQNLILVSLFGDIDSNNSRISNIYNYSFDHVMKVITSDFDHGLKGYKKKKYNSSIKYLHVPSYKKNLSVKRIFSHLIFAYKLNKYLNNLPNKPEVIYCAMPTSSAAYVCGKYCKKHGIKFVIDVIDLWPDSIVPMFGSVGKLLDLILFPWRYITIQAYKLANIIVGESKKYAEIAHSFNPSVIAIPLYIGVDQSMTTSLIFQSNIQLYKPENEIWIAYGGSLGTSYDFEVLIKSVSLLNGFYKYKLFFIGDGVCRSSIEKMISQYKITAVITGFTLYHDYLKYLSFCDIAINIFRDNTKVVHSYKFNDYVATNCFILNSLPGETADMITNYQIGLNFDFKKNSLDNVLLKCLENWNVYKHWKDNNQRLVSELLDKKIIYSKFTRLLSSDQ